MRVLLWVSSCSLGGVLLVQGCWLSRDGTAPVRATGTGASGAGSVGGGGSGAGGGTTTSSTSSGGADSESCLDGVDNDGDGDVDCADSDCVVGFSCVPAVDGALAYLTPPQAPPSCEAPTEPIEIQYCEGCQCNDASATCTATVMAHQGFGCPGSGTTYTSPQDCVDVQDGYYSFTATTTPILAESCAAVAATVDPTVREGCSVSEAGSCSTGEACVPSSLVGGSICVLLPGHVDCPVDYPSRGDAYQGAAGPCACTCEPYNPLCDDVSIEFSTWNDGCGDLSSSVVGAGCVEVGGVASFLVPAVSGTATCDPSGTPSGATDVTLCCTQ